MKIRIARAVRPMILAGLLALGGGFSGPARAGEEDLRIGVILPLSGPFALVGREIKAGIETFMAQNPATLGGRAVVLIFRDSQGAGHIAKREAQELVVNEHVAILAGLGTTPDALAVAPVATQAELPMIVMGSGGGAVTSASANIVRTAFNIGQIASVAGTYLAGTGKKTAVSLVADFGPGIESETGFAKAFEAGGGKMIATLRSPFESPAFAPFLQRAADLHPDGLFLFVPQGQNAVLMREFAERGLARSGIGLITTGDVLDESLIDQIGPAVLGVTSIYHYSDVHPSALNQRFVADFERVSGGLRANMMGVSGYDGMRLIQLTLEKTKGQTKEFVAAAKGLAWESPRGQVRIDPATRDIEQDMYVRRVERRGDRLVNVEIATVPVPVR